MDVRVTSYVHVEEAFLCTTACTRSCVHFQEGGCLNHIAFRTDTICARAKNLFLWAIRRAGHVQVQE